MAGRPKMRKLLADIEKVGGVDSLCDMIANGSTLADLGREFGVHRNMIWEVLRKNSDAYEAAKRRRAGVWADEVKEIADSTPADPNEINLSKMRIDSRKWLAGIDDPATYGQQQQKVEVNIGQLHLNALRKVNEVVVEGRVGGRLEEVRDVGEG